MILANPPDSLQRGMRLLATAITVRGRPAASFIKPVVGILTVVAVGAAAAWILGDNLRTRRA